MSEKKKQYRADHESVIVLCPRCGDAMQGWTLEEGAPTYWINHVVPRKTGKRCLVKKDQMVPVIKAWEEKYEYVTDP